MIKCYKFLYKIVHKKILVVVVEKTVDTLFVTQVLEVKSHRFGAIQETHFSPLKKGFLPFRQTQSFLDLE